MSGCGRHVPSDDELTAVASNQESHPEALRDLAFPYGAACHAISTCKRIADMLENHLEARPDLIATATDDWNGGHRDEYDETWGFQESKLSGIKDGLRLLIGDIEDAWDEADSINDNRAEIRESGDYDPRHYAVT